MAQSSGMSLFSYIRLILGFATFKQEPTSLYICLESNGVIGMHDLQAA